MVRLWQKGQSHLHDVTGTMPGVPLSKGEHSCMLGARYALLKTLMYPAWNLNLSHLKFSFHSPRIVIPRPSLFSSVGVIRHWNGVGVGGSETLHHLYQAPKSFVIKSIISSDESPHCVIR